MVMRRAAMVLGAAVAALLGASEAFVTAPAMSLAQHPASAFTGVSLRQMERPAGSPAASGLTMIRHGCRVAKLGKPADQRRALLRSLTTEVIRHGRIKTTLIRARAVRKHVDHMIQLGKNGSLHSRRQAMGFMYDKALVHALFEQAPERYGERNGGYCRVLKTTARQGDNAKMAIIELV